MKKSSLLLLTAIMALVLAFAGCSAETSGDAAQSEPVDVPVNEETESADAHYPVTIQTYNYAKEPIEVTFDKAPEKVFAVYQDSIETLLALGLEDRIVACAGLDQDVKEEYQAGFEKVNYLTEFSPDKESVIMLEPDFILSWYSYFSDKKLGEVDYWHDNGIGTYMMLNSGAAPEKTLENEYTDILNLGKIFDVEDKAQALVAQMKEKVNQIAEPAQQMEDKPRVLLMEFEKDGVRVYGENTLGGDMVKQLGAELVTAPENHMSSEDLIFSDPDVIFTVYFGSSNSIADGEMAISKFFEDPQYASLRAVEGKNIYPISLGEMYCSGTRTLDGITRLAEGIYPTLVDAE